MSTTTSGPAIRPQTGPHPKGEAIDALEELGILSTDLVTALHRGAGRRQSQHVLRITREALTKLRTAEDHVNLDPDLED